MRVGQQRGGRGGVEQRERELVPALQHRRGVTGLGRDRVGGTAYRVEPVVTAVHEEGGPGVAVVGPGRELERRQHPGTLRARETGCSGMLLRNAVRTEYVRLGKEGHRVAATVRASARDGGVAR